MEPGSQERSVMEPQYVCAFRAAATENLHILQARLDRSLVFVEPDFLGCLACSRVSSLNDRAKFLSPSVRNITSLFYSLSFDQAR
jgi:hypothetical protein